MYGKSWIQFKSVEQTYLFNNLLDNTLLIKCKESVIDLDRNQDIMKKFLYQEKIFYLMDIPIEFLEDYRKIISSKYSTIEDIYKKKIIKFHGIRSDSKYKKILYREESYYKEMEEKLAVNISRLAEIGDAINIEQETLEIPKDEIKELEKFKRIEW